MSGGPAAWDPPEGWEAPEDDVTWRGDLHREGWPEELAGPEYRMYRDQLEDEEN